jgi:hypothetical protein
MPVLAEEVSDKAMAGASRLRIVPKINIFEVYDLDEAFDSD